MKSGASWDSLVEWFRDVFLGRSDLGLPQGGIQAQRAAGEAGAEPDYLRPLRVALLSEFGHLNGKLKAQRGMDRDRICLVDEIAILPLTPEAQTALDELLQHRDEASVIDLIRRGILVDIELALYFDFAEFRGIRRLNQSGQPRVGDAEDPALEKELRDVMREIGMDESSDQFEIRVGYWFKTPASAHELPRDSTNWLLSDAETPRRLSLDPVPQDRPLRIGRRPDCEIPIKATGKTLASGHHGDLWFDGGAWWYRDVGSTNGSRIEDDTGVKRIPPAGRPSLPVRLRAGSVIVFCAKEAGAEETPETHPSLRWEGDRAAVPETPLAEASDPVVPETPTSPDRARMSFLVRLSGAGEEITELTSLPATVGKDAHHDVRVPSGYASVSRHHLTLRSMDKGGVEIEVHGRNGVTHRGKIVRRRTRFTLAWGEPIGLGYPTENEPVCSLTVERR